MRRDGRASPGAGQQGSTEQATVARPTSPTTTVPHRRGSGEQNGSTHGGVMQCSRTLLRCEMPSSVLGCDAMLTARTLACTPEEEDDCVRGAAPERREVPDRPRPSPVSTSTSTIPHQSDTLKLVARSPVPEQPVRPPAAQHRLLEAEKPSHLPTPQLELSLRPESLLIPFLIRPQSYCRSW